MNKTCLLKKGIVGTIISICIGICICMTMPVIIKAATKKVPAYGYDKSGKWSYHITNRSKKTVEIRPANLDRIVIDFKSSTITIPQKIKINKKKYTVERIASSAFSVCICNKCYTFGQTVSQKWKDASNAGKDNINNSYYTSIKAVNIPSTVTSIGDYAFAGQSNITSINFLGNSNLKTIGKSAFNNVGISKIIFPSLTNSIGESAFKNNKKLSSIGFKGNKLTTIGNNAFSGNLITELTLPSSLKNVGEYAFSDNRRLKKVNINASNIDGYRKTLFDGEIITEFYVNTYATYKKLQSNLSVNTSFDEAKIYSNETLVHFVTGKTTKSVYVKKGQSVDYRKYAYFDKGKTVSSLTKIVVVSLDGTKDTKGNVSPTETYVADGTPEVFFNIEQKDIKYTITELAVYPFIVAVDRHYNCDNSSLSTNVYCYFDKITLGEEPDNLNFNKSGYEIDGYEINGKKYLANETVSGLSEINGSELKIGFHYVPNQYHINYDANGGSNNQIYTQYCLYGSTYKLTDKTPTRDGYKFVGWNTASDGTGTNYSRAGQVSNLTTEKDGETTLYAKWSLDDIFVTYNANGGTVNTRTAYVKNSKVYGTLPIPVKTGFKFVGWEDETGHIVNANMVPICNYDHSLKALWRANKVSERYRCNNPLYGTKFVGYRVTFFVNNKQIEKINMSRINRTITYKFNNLKDKDKLIVKVKGYKYKTIKKKVKVKAKKKGKKKYVYKYKKVKKKVWGKQIVLSKTFDA